MIPPVVSVALRALAANTLRSVLAVLGVVIGVSAVIVMLSMGRGVESRVTNSINALGVNLLFVNPGQRGAGMSTARNQPAETLTLEDAAALARRPGIRAVAPDVTRNFQVKALNVNRNSRVVGTVPEYLEVRNYKIASGAFFTDSDIVSKRRVVVLGAKAARDFFGELDPIDRTLQIDRKNFRVVGVLEEKGAQAFLNFDEYLYIPVTTAQVRLIKRTMLSQIIVSVEDGDRLDEVLADVDAAMQRRHRPGPDGQPDFTVTSMTEMRQRMADTTGAFTLLLSGIAFVSLLVGGIGIMNIMLVSVTERTREIGIRMAVGARGRDLLEQFLVESVAISLLGGTLGILAGWAGSHLFVRLPFLQALVQGEWSAEVSPESVAMSFGFSCAVGIFFGIYPAMKAARMNPVDALRYE